MLVSRLILELQRLENKHGGNDVKMMTLGDAGFRKCDIRLVKFTDGYITIHSDEEVADGGW